MSMQDSIAPADDTMDKILEAAKTAAALLPSAPDTGEPCPVCGGDPIVRNGHLVCISDFCKERILEGCCGD